MIHYPEVPTIFTVRDRDGNIVEHYVKAGSRIGIPDDIEVISEIPAAPDMILRGNDNG